MTTIYVTPTGKAMVGFGLCRYIVQRTDTAGRKYHVLSTNSRALVDRTLARAKRAKSTYAVRDVWEVRS
jgi:hypothetical protein